MDSNDILEIDKKNTNLEFLKELPYDQYLCPFCEEVPEILDIDYNNNYSIKLMCKIHGEKDIPIEEYFEKESTNLYINKMCGKDKKTLQKKFKNCLFDFCPECKVFICGACSINHVHQKDLFKINKLNCICREHFEEYIAYCNNCKKNICNKDITCENHDLQNFEEASKNDIDDLLNERNKLLKDKELLEYYIALINTLLKTYFEHPKNYYHIINIKNMAEIITKNHENQLNIVNREALIAKIDNLEQAALNYLNVKFKIELKGDEIVIDLNGKNVTNIDFGLLSEINFKNAEKMILNHNNISDISPLRNFKSPKLKYLDLSYNKINDITAFKQISQKEQKIEVILLNNNKINNADIFKNKIFPFIKDINLDENRLLQKDIEEIKDIINGKKIRKISSQNNIVNNTRYKVKKETKKLILIPFPFPKLPIINNRNLHSSFYIEPK